jgi:hypothetical protein
LQQRQTLEQGQRLIELVVDLLTISPGSSLVLPFLSASSLVFLARSSLASFAGVTILVVAQVLLKIGFAHFHLGLHYW